MAHLSPDHSPKSPDPTSDRACIIPIAVTYYASDVDLRGARYLARSSNANESIDSVYHLLRCPTMAFSLTTVLVRVSLFRCHLLNARAQILARILRLDADLPFSLSL